VEEPPLVLCQERRVAVDASRSFVRRSILGYRHVLRIAVQVRTAKGVWRIIVLVHCPSVPESGLA
jgi:hypothetical protein